MADEPVDTENTFNNLTINNKTVSEITNNSNNKIVDSIIIGNTIIYQRNESNVSEKINTQFVESKSELWLQDINGNGLRGKNIIYQACDNNTLTTFTKNSSFDGGTFLSPTNIKCVVFEGDEEYNGCSHENSNFKGCRGSIPSPKG